MPTLAITRSVVDGTAFTQAQNETQCTDVETFLNTTKINSTNIQSSGISADNLAAGIVDSSKLAANAVGLAAVAADLLAKLLPAGMVSAYGGSSSPTGWLICDGSAVSRTTYASLFAVVSTHHGSGNGSTTFNLPDYRGRFLRGWDNAAGNDPDAAGRTALASGGSTGDAIGSLQAGGNASHNHSVTDPGHNHNIIWANNVAGANPMFNSTFNQLDSATQANVSGTRAIQSASTGISLVAAGGNEARPVNVTVNYIIKI